MSQLMENDDKIKTIRLSDGVAPSSPGVHDSEEKWRQALRFRVEQVTDSVEYHTGQLLERREVESLCESPRWKVTIVPRR